MSVETNLTTTAALGQVKSIDFANRFGDNINKLLEVLGVSNKLPMNVGSNIKLYKYSVNEPTEQNVAEGDEIPYSLIT